MSSNLQGVSVKTMVSSYETRLEPPVWSLSSSINGGSNNDNGQHYPRSHIRVASPVRGRLGNEKPHNNNTDKTEKMRNHANLNAYNENLDKKNLLPLLLFFHSGSSSSSMIAIDNKIERAMDLVKSHLMYAVREEVEVLKEQIKELTERNALLEQENSLLRSLASPEQLSQVMTKTRSAGVSSTPQTGTTSA